jgi:hypothetical protein
MLHCGSLSAPFACGLMGGFGFLRFRCAFAGQAVEFGLNIVLDPFLIPPFHRQDRDAVKIDAEVQVIAAGKAGFAGLADGLSLLDLVADFDVGGTQMLIKGE